jgi:hypothetical protein
MVGGGVVVTGQQHRCRAGQPPPGRDRGVGAATGEHGQRRQLLGAHGAQLGHRDMCRRLSIGATVIRWRM